MACTVKNLRSAKRNKNDEFYTLLPDIEKEVMKYKAQFKNKVVYLNCDDPEESNFWKFFQNNFQSFQLKGLVSTHYNTWGSAYKLEIHGDLNGDGKINGLDIIKTKLVGDGDFRSEECVDILKRCDIVCTNPPFSLFNEYIDMLMEHNKKFLVIGNLNASGYASIFKMFIQNKMKFGYRGCGSFIFNTEDGEKKFGNIGWFTNMRTRKSNEYKFLTKTYYGNEEEYPKYDHYGAINVDKVKDIPSDYFGEMGVPITFLTAYDPDQFEVLYLLSQTSLLSADGVLLRGRLLNNIGDSKKYLRVIIRRKDNKNTCTANNS